MDKPMVTPDSYEAAEIIGRSLARLEKSFTGRVVARNLAVLGLLAAPSVALVVAALRPNPKQMWAQRWPTIAFVGLYQIALDRYVQVEGLEYLPETGPVLLAGNHINKTAMDGMLLGSKILALRGAVTKFVSIADPDSWMLKRFVRLMGNAAGVILPIQKGMTTETMIHFLQNPAAFNREQSILGIFPAGEASPDFAKQMNVKWHTGVAVAAVATGAAIVPFYVEGLPYHWGPSDMLMTVARSLAGGKAFDFRIRLGPPIRPDGSKDQRNYEKITECVRQAVLQLA